MATKHLLEMEPVDPLMFRNVMGTFATGVAVVTSVADGVDHGMTMNALTSVSLEPCMLLICPRRGSATGRAISESGHFVVNILTSDQNDLSSQFMGNFEDRFEGVDVESSYAGPMLAGALAHIGCRVSNIHTAGDHDIVLAEALFCNGSEGSPLLFFKGGLGGFAPEGATGSDVGWSKAPRRAGATGVAKF
ncbi:flavin reductase family protein [Pseudooceanicola sp.]|uniref:flavin reductase family protein n=1 Tax=Pseudooceanicola sp. TaxID=1914328 RepID=UPI003511038C